jgi:putative ABC transport system permease protein
MPMRDLRYAMRQLSRTPGFTLTAILTLAFGIGATTAIFSIVEGVLLRPLPFADPGRLVTLGDRLEGVSYGLEAPGVTAPGAVIYSRDTHAFSSVGASKEVTYELSGMDEPAQIDAARLTAGVFPTLGISPLMGRAFTAQEDEAGHRVADISYQMWHNRFHGDPRIIGQTILLDRKPYEVIGVMPREFEYPLEPGQLNRAELWVPMSFTQAELVQGAGAWAYSFIGRLKPGVTPQQAQEDAVGAAQEIVRNLPPALSSRRVHPWVQPLDEVTIEEARPLVRTLLIAVAFVLFIACANLAGLLLVRVIRRRREISVRLALGANGAAILRQSLFEALVLSFAGGLLGLALAAVALRTGISLLPETLPRVSSIGLDWQVVAFSILLSVLTGFLCGLLPAYVASRTRVNDALKEGGRTGSASSGHARLRSALVIVELAVALVLLSCSGLLLRSFEKMRNADIGFRTDHTLTAAYSLPRQQYSTQAAIDAFDTVLRTRLEQLPGVQAVGSTTLLPAANIDYRATFTAEGYVPPKGAGLNLSWVPEVMGNYFEAQGIRIVRGRSFASSDNANSPPVAIVNRKLAEHYWPGQDPIGKRLHRGPAQADVPWLTIVGEIGDLKDHGADSPAENQIYILSSQSKAAAGTFAPPDMLTGNAGTIVIRASLPPAQMADSLRAAVRSIDPQLPLTNIEAMDSVVAEGMAPHRFVTILMSCFAVAAVLLAFLGIYSVIAFTAALRTQELAIRLALGSQRAGILRLVLGSAAKLGAAGCCIGIAATLFAAQLLRSMLFEVGPLDPLVILLAATSIFLLALAASVIPARRAASVEPMQALRTE